MADGVMGFVPSWNVSTGKLRPLCATGAGKNGTRSGSWRAIGKSPAAMCRFAPNRLRAASCFKIGPTTANSASPRHFGLSNMNRHLMASDSPTMRGGGAGGNNGSDGRMISRSVAPNRLILDPIDCAGAVAPVRSALDNFVAVPACGFFARSARRRRYEHE